MYFFVGCDPCGRPAPIMFKAVFCLSCCFCICGQPQGYAPTFFCNGTFTETSFLKINLFYKNLIFSYLKKTCKELKRAYRFLISEIIFVLHTSYPTLKLANSLAK